MCVRYQLLTTHQLPLEAMLDELDLHQVQWLLANLSICDLHSRYIFIKNIKCIGLLKEQSFSILYNLLLW